MGKLSLAQYRRLVDVQFMSRRPGGFLAMYEPDRTWVALESRGLVTKDQGGRLTEAGQAALLAYKKEHGLIE